MMVIEPAGAEDQDAVLDLLARAKLPEAGLRNHLDTLFVARLDGRIVGSAALELYGASALLRSVAVEDACRGQGIGRCLTDAALFFATIHGIRTVYLLTETAQAFFLRQGFTVVDRDAVPPSVRTSAEFAYACPESAPVMMRDLG